MLGALGGRGIRGWIKAEEEQADSGWEISVCAGVLPAEGVSQGRLKIPCVQVMP